MFKNNVSLKDKTHLNVGNESKNLSQLFLRYYIRGRNSFDCDVQVVSRMISTITDNVINLFGGARIRFAA